MKLLKVYLLTAMLLYFIELRMHHFLDVHAVVLNHVPQQRHQKSKGRVF